MAPTEGNTPALDPTALADALRVLGIFYGTKTPLANTIAGATDEAEAIRAYIRQERAHLLASYEMDVLVSMVMAARASNARAPASIEQFNPS